MPTSAASPVTSLMPTPTRQPGASAPFARGAKASCAAAASISADIWSLVLFMVSSARREHRPHRDHAVAFDHGDVAELLEHRLALRRAQEDEVVGPKALPARTQEKLLVRRGPDQAAGLQPFGRRRACQPVAAVDEVGGALVAVPQLRGLAQGLDPVRRE